jgi:predicted nuclease of predicted toxin-antitoxin system
MEPTEHLRLLANENFPGAVIEALRARGHDVAWVHADARGSSDEQVLARALAERRTLITFDKDFGELAYHARLPASSGVILFRIAPRSEAFILHTAIAALESGHQWAGHFAVVEEDRIRIIPLPTDASS